MDVDLPASVQEIADVIGRERALYLVGQLGPCGSRSWRRSLYVPKPDRMKPDCRLVRILGWDDAMRLAEAMPGAVLQPGSCRELLLRWRDLSIRRLYRRGLSKAQIAEWFGLSDRRVRWIIEGC